MCGHTQWSSWPRLVMIGHCMWQRWLIYWRVNKVIHIHPRTHTPPHTEPIYSSLLNFIQQVQKSCYFFSWMPVSMVTTNTMQLSKMLSDFEDICLHLCWEIWLWEKVSHCFEPLCTMIKMLKLFSKKHAARYLITALYMFYFQVLSITSTSSESHDRLPWQPSVVLLHQLLILDYDYKASQVEAEKQTLQLEFETQYVSIKP